MSVLHEERTSEGYRRTRTAARPEALEAKEPCQRGEPTRGARSGTKVGTPEWSEDAGLVGGHVLTERSVTQREEEDVRAWHAFLPRGSEGDL